MIRVAFLILLLSSAVYSEQNRDEMFWKYLDLKSLIQGGSVEPNWMKDGFWYAEGMPDKTVIYRVTAQERKPLFDAARLRQKLAKVLGHEPPYEGVPFSEFTFVSESIIQFTVEEKQFEFNLDTYEIKNAEPYVEQERSRSKPRVVRKGFRSTQRDIMEVPSPDGRWFAGDKDFNIVLRSISDDRYQQLTTDGIKDYQWDVEGAKWSPDSLRLAVLKTDNRDLALLPIVHWLKPIEEVEWARYTKAGGAMTQTELHIIDVPSRRNINVDLGRESLSLMKGETEEGVEKSNCFDCYIFIIGWLPDGSELLFFRIDREFKKLDVMAANPETGASRIVLTETQKTFIQALPWNYRDGVEEYKLLLTPLKNSKQFIWMSERDGWSHLYLYDLRGNLIKRLTSGAFPVLRVVGIDEKEGWVYFTANAEKRLYDTNLYRVNFKGEGFKRLTEETGEHTIRFSPSYTMFVDTYSTPAQPQVVELRDSGGKLLQTLSKANIDRLAEIQWKAPEEFVAKASDGKTDLYGLIYKPFDFDPNKQYPVIDFIYGGPQVKVVAHSFGGGLWDVLPHAFAQPGFIVITVDARGTPDRGKVFQDVVYGNFGRNEIPDHVAVLKQLAAQRSYMDMNRVGIMGGSWGGYMTVRGMLLAPDVYRVGVATYPVYDLYDHRAGPIEPYMGLPQHNRDGYEYGSSLKLAANLKGKLLLIHGTSDVNATFSATMKMVDALMQAGKPYDLIVFPESTHGLTGRAREYWLDAARKYFVENLGGRKSK